MGLFYGMLRVGNKTESHICVAWENIYVRLNSGDVLQTIVFIKQRLFVLRHMLRFRKESAGVGGVVGNHDKRGKTIDTS